MLRRVLLLTAAPALVLIAASTIADSGQNRQNKRAFAELKPTEEVPAVSSQAARGRFKATIDEQNQTISYELSYEGLEAPALQAHIHIGQRRVNGGVSVFLCGNPPTVPAAPTPQPPACPPAPATVTGELTAANIVGPTAQGVDPTSATVNEFDELVAMLRRELAYVNVHSSRFPGGEIRGQVRFSHKKSH